MVKQTQADILDMLIGSGSDLSEYFTPDGDVLGFQTHRPMDSNSIDFLDDSVLDPLNVALCQDIQETPEPSAEIDIEQSQFTFDPSETSIEILKLMAATSGDNNDLPLGDIVEFQDVGEEVETEEIVSPVLKAEIKNRIKKRRQEEGKEEIKDLFTEPEPERLTEEEQQKRVERREKNKLAAQKCRSKKRKIAETLEEETERLEEKQDRLKDEVQRLREERDHLMELVKVHSAVCPKMACSH